MERPPQRSLYGAHCQRVARQPPGYASALNSPSNNRQNPDLETINEPPSPRTALTHFVLR